MKFPRALLFTIVFFVLSGSLIGQTGRIALATTTSTENSGLLAELLPPFEASTGIRVDVIAVGTGAAIRLGEAGDVDVILVHAPDAEDAFVQSGFGVNRRRVMHNDFVLLGPDSDPARIQNSSSAADAFQRIAGSGATGFISRGDDSGTHKKERELWRSAEVSPSGRWYQEVGQGMGAVIMFADETKGYTLADRGTYLSMRDRIEIEVLYEGDPELFNPYSIIAVNPAVHPHARYRDAMQLIAWCTSVEGQAIIRGFRSSGELLFQPDAIP